MLQISLQGHIVGTSNYEHLVSDFSFALQIANSEVISNSANTDESVLIWCISELEKNVNFDTFQSVFKM